MKKWHIAVFLAISMSLLIFGAIKRKQKLKQEGIDGIAHIYKLEQGVISGTISRRTRVDFEYYYNGKRYTGSRKILNSSVSENNCYLVQFLADKPETVDIFFGKERSCPDNLLSPR